MTSVICAWLAPGGERAAMLSLISTESSGARGWTRALLILGVSILASSWLSLWVTLCAAAIGVPMLLPAPAQEVVVLGAAALAWRLLTTTLGERMIGTLITLGAILAALIAVWARFYHQWAPVDPRWLARVPSTHPVGPVVTTVLIVLALWWTGSRIAASSLDEYAVFRFFAAGVAGLFAALIIGAHTVPTGVLVTSVIIFFATTFITLPAAQLVHVRERGKARGTRLPALDRHWAATASAAMLSVVLLALILTALSSAAVLALALDLLARIPDLLLFILYPFVLAIGYLIQALVSLVRDLMGHHGTALRSPVLQPKTPRFPQGHQSQGHLPLVVHAILGGAILLVLAVIVVAVLSRAVRRLGARRLDQAFEEERDSVWSWDEANDGWRGILERLRSRLGRDHPGAPDSDSGPPRSIRDAYRRLLRRTAALGHARAAAETPLEYLERLQDIPIPDEQDVALLTGAYMGVRYGEEAEQPEEIAQAAHAWARLDQALPPPSPT